MYQIFWDFENPIYFLLSITPVIFRKKNFDFFICESVLNFTSNFLHVAIRNGAVLTTQGDAQ